MPIEGVSNVIRLPRLGKIRLGIKVEKPEKAPYPQATDHFVVPPKVQEVYGEKPTELDIMFPCEDPDLFAQQWLRAYSTTQGLVCIGDGATSRRKVDIETGAVASHETKQWEWKEELPCNPQDCPEYLMKRCRRVMNLQFILPYVPGLGVWQIDTSSFYSILNINSMIRMLQPFGRYSFIPLRLCLGPVEVSPPGLSKKTVHIMHIRRDITFAELAKAAARPALQAFIPEPEVEEPPDDLIPPAVIAAAEEAPPHVEVPQDFSREKAIEEIEKFFDAMDYSPTTREIWLNINTGFGKFEDCPDEPLARALEKGRGIQRRLL